MGTLGEEYTIKLKQGAVSYVLLTTRRVPIRKKVEDELLQMQTTGIISPVYDPSPWCARMVVVPKSSGSVRITHLNQNVLREYHPLPNVNDTLAQLPRILHFRLRLMRYSFTIYHVPGKYLYMSCMTQQQLLKYQ